MNNEEEARCCFMCEACSRGGRTTSDGNRGFWCSQIDEEILDVRAPVVCEYFIENRAI